MAKQKEQPKPFYRAKNDLIDSQKAYMDAVMMLRTQAASIVGFMEDSSDPVMQKLAPMLKEKIKELDFAAMGDE